VGARSTTSACPGCRWTSCTTAAKSKIQKEIDTHRDRHTSRFSQHPFYILNEGGRRYAWSLNVIFGGAARALVCMLYGVGRAHAHVPGTSRPPGRHRGCLGTRPANFPAWGAREGGFAPETHCFGCQHLCDVLAESRDTHIETFCAPALGESEQHPFQVSVSAE
jgi:hypothetical protein